MSIYQLTISPSVVRHCQSDTFINVTATSSEAQAYREWLAAGGVPDPANPPYALYSPEHFRAIRDAAFTWMDAEVRARGYDDIPNCASYYNSSVTRYRQEARALVAWRDAVNQKLEQLVLAPPVGVETWEQVRVLLPQPEDFSWPETVSLPLDNREVAGL
ncbi:hypothetical protein [Stenotrophomonas maltophilia]|uniref:hypothetical protein n=1 Tax=Stenotrophomonas maltophilia TaxID=40324 RepID=UPI0018D49BDB|nr:hypothetical protein [Stenotrophomonas maltophilia]MBH1527582.1 hypothetical protein [Stenotrophomonas maltophilia]